MTNLTSLDLDSNQLRYLPDKIGNLLKLTALSLTANKIRFLPDSFRGLINLNVIHLGCNTLADIPDIFRCFNNLKRLDLSQNQITYLPDSIQYLPNLTILELSGNPLIDLSILQFIPSLEKVYIFIQYLPRRYWMKFSNWNPEWLLDQENAEIRRRLIEQVGYEKICDKLGAIALDSWREYHLLKIHANVDVEPIFLLKMTCPSTNHIHILRVPPTMTSAEVAITWINLAFILTILQYRLSNNSMLDRSINLDVYMIWDYRLYR